MKVNGLKEINKATEKRLMIVVIYTKDNGSREINKVVEKRFIIVAVYTREHIIKT